MKYVLHQFSSKPFVLAIGLSTGNPKASLQGMYDAQELRKTLMRGAMDSQRAASTDGTPEMNGRASADSKAPPPLENSSPTKRSREGSPQEEDISPPKLQKGEPAKVNVKS